MRPTKAASALLLAAALTTMMSGCSIGLLDPTQSTSTPSEASAPDNEQRTPEQQSETEQSQTEQSQTEQNDTGLSPEGQAARDRLIALASTTMPCPTEPIDALGRVIRVEGSCPKLTIHMSGGAVIADDVEALDVSGQSVTVFVKNVKSITVGGAANEIYWEGDTPTVQDNGLSNLLQQG